MAGCTLHSGTTRVSDENDFAFEVAFLPRSQNPAGTNSQLIIEQCKGEHLHAHSQSAHSKVALSLHTLCCPVQRAAAEDICHAKRQAACMTLQSCGRALQVHAVSHTFLV